MVSLAEFLSPEAGQRRTRWLNDKLDAGYGTLRYYLGAGNSLPQGAAGLARAMEFTDAGDFVEAADASRDLWNDPSVGTAARYAASGAALAMPFVGAKMVNEGTDILGSAVDDFMAGYDPNTVNAFTVWHGSPHKFDKFDMDRIGTGEGAQAYGHGLYFADNPDVARNYQEQLSLDGLVKLKGQDEQAAYADNAIAAIREGRSTGSLYEVSIDAEPEDFLDWDAPLSGQTGKPRQALDDFFEWYAGPEGRQEIYDSGVDLRDIHQQFDDLSPRQFAAAMRARGVPGSRYRDAGSRGMPGGLGSDETRNYVLFDDSLADIIGVDGQRSPEGQGQAVLNLLTSGRASEVTDDMLDMGDPALNARLNEYLWNNYDLPMDEASRMARAGDMGFETPAYHSTDTDIGAVDNERLIGGQFWSTDDIDAVNRGEVGAAGRGTVIPLQVQQQNPAGWREYDQLGVDELMGRGYDGLRLPESDGTNTFVTFDPEQVRSRFARFDPRLSHLRNLSAGVGGLGLLGGLMSSEEELKEYLEGA